MYLPLEGVSLKVKHINFYNGYEIYIYKFEYYTRLGLARIRK